MSDSLGLSIGTANLVAARAGHPPITRRSVLTLFDHQAPEVGVPAENPNLTEPGLVLRGFVERIGDPIPLIAPDGSTHRSDALTVEALDAMARTVGYGAPVAIAVPAHWGDGLIEALRNGLQGKPGLTPNGVPAALVSDAATALAALDAKPGLPDGGVVVVCDFGASGSSVTLTDAASNFQPIGATVRYRDFSGEQIDRAILDYLPAGTPDSAGALPAGSLTRRRDDCRHAKEQLSTATVTTIASEFPDGGQGIGLSRTDLVGLISGSLEGFLTTVAQTLHGNGIPTTHLAAIAAVGGGAAIPLITERLSDRFRVPVITAPQPMLSAAIGAALLAERGPSAAPPTGAATGTPAASDTAIVTPPRGVADVDAPVATDIGAATNAPAGTDMAANAPTDMAPSAWAVNAARDAAGESVSDGAQSATYRALAWSEDDSAAAEPLPYSGDGDAGDYGAGPELDAGFDEGGGYGGGIEPQPWRKRSAVLFGLAAAAAATALLGAGLLAFKLTSATGNPTETTNEVTAPSAPVPISPQPPPITKTVTGPPAPAGPPPPPPAPPTTTATPIMTTTQPTTTAPTTQPTTTAPTTQPTTTAPTTQPTTTAPTTTVPTTQPTTTHPPLTTTQLPTSRAVIPRRIEPFPPTYRP